MDKPHFDNISLLITHYNRSDALKDLLSRFSKLCSFDEIIVSDDASKEEHLSIIKKLKKDFEFILVEAEKNSGLANNINKGHRKASNEYVLYIQEDFMPEQLFINKLRFARKEMDEREDLDIVRFYAYTKFPYLTPYKGGFSEMNFSIMLPSYHKFYYYSDHPHLKRKSFTKKFGEYVEGIDSDQAEFKMMMKFLKRNGKGLFYDDYNSLFWINAPSSLERSDWKQARRESKNPALIIAREVYRHLNFNIKYFLTK